MSTQRLTVISSSDLQRVQTASVAGFDPDEPLRSGSMAATSRERVVEALLDLQGQVPFVAALLTIRRKPDGPDVPVYSYRMAAEHIRDGLDYFIPRSPDFALVLASPREVLDWSRVTTFRETAIAKEHLLSAGFTQGVSFAFFHDQRVVGTFHVNFVHTEQFDDAELVALDRARAALEVEISSLVLAGDIGLTERELQVLRLMSDGSSNVQIGDELQISRHTVKSHVESILHKLRASNRVQAVKRAASLAII